MPDMKKLAENKDRIISIIQSQGPSFPTRISQQTGIPSLFVSALLAELASEKKLKISNMKVGSSPLYFTQGQEDLLENFIQYLNPKEREAFETLKNSEILEDEKLSPAIRVALRNIKDFAHPINVKLSSGENPKLFWKFFTVPKNQIKTKIQTLLTNETKQTRSTPKTQSITETQPITSNPNNTSILRVGGRDSRSRPKQRIISEFANSIRSILQAKDIEILSEISEKKKEFTAKIRLDETFGKQSYYLIAKDKKKVTINDLSLALQQAQSEKMPALFISPGELDKKAQAHLKEWSNLIKFERVKI